jgi:signal transduction histidine kinase
VPTRGPEPLPRGLGLGLALGVLLAAAAVAQALGQARADHQAHARAALQLAATHLQAARTEGEEDARFLAAAPAVRRAAEGAPGAAEEVAALFRAYADARQSMFQVRLLDGQGREQVRLERRGSAVAAADELQDKRDRPYFQSALKLPAGAVAVSPLDLNVEHGQVEQPPRPTWRFSSPVWVGGAPQGVVVLNLEARGLLDDFAREGARQPGAWLLLDAQGHALVHPEAGRAFGPRTLGQDRPALAGWVLGGPGELFSGAGVWAARAQVGQGEGALVGALLATPGQALWSEGGRWAPLSAACAVALGLLLGGAQAWRRQRQLGWALAQLQALHRELQVREERLVASARLAALAESAAALAHEVRNPLAAIVQSTSLLRSAPLLGEDRELLDIVRAESERLERAVAGFLALARPEPPRPTRVDLAEAARRVVALARHEPAFAPPLVLADVAGAATLHADPDEVHQVLWNLLLNAAAATRRAGGVTVQVRLQGHAMEVWDEGPGPLAPGAPRPAGLPGTGLGLIVVAGIVARAGGRFAVTARTDRPGAVARAEWPAEA